MLRVYVADRVSQARSEIGASSVDEPTDQKYGDRSAGVRDAFGNTWWIAQRVRTGTG